MTPTTWIEVYFADGAICPVAFLPDVEDRISRTLGSWWPFGSITLPLVEGGTITVRRRDVSGYHVTSPKTRENYRAFEQHLADEGDSEAWQS
jgi:hypothetical protein